MTTAGELLDCGEEGECQGPGEEESSPHPAKPRLAKKSRAEARQVGSLLRHSRQPGACFCLKNPSHLPAPASFPRHLSQQTLHPALPGVPSRAARRDHKIRDGRGAGRGVRAPPSISSGGWMAEGWLTQLCPACSGHAAIHPPAAPAPALPRPGMIN